MVSAARLFRDPAGVAEMFLGTPYLWGGNSRLGIDCSGLVQAACLACGLPRPGDSGDQSCAAGAPVAEDPPLARGDPLFWKGHVAMAVGPEPLVHCQCPSHGGGLANLAEAKAGFPAVAAAACWRGAGWCWTEPAASDQPDQLAFQHAKHRGQIVAALQDLTPVPISAYIPCRWRRRGCFDPVERRLGGAPEDREDGPVAQVRDAVVAPFAGGGPCGRRGREEREFRSLEGDLFDQLAGTGNGVGAELS